MGRIRLLGMWMAMAVVALVAPPAADAQGVAPAPWTVADRATDAVAALASRLAADVAADGVGSVAAAVVVGDSVVWRGAFGVADRSTGAAATPATLYRIGSITKPLTALLLLALVERGVVELDDPVAPHLPELHRLADRPGDHRPITFRDLATHRAGLAREPASSRAGRGPFREWKRRLVDAIPTTSMEAKPGAAHGYSNIGYGLLGFALERAAGRPYEELLRELVLEPLGMVDTHLLVPRSERSRLAAGYVNPSPDTIDPRVPRAEHRGRGYRVPGEGLYSTVDDLARLVMAMTGALGDTPVDAGLRTLALDDDGSGYGLGFQLHRAGAAFVAGHSGTVPGYSAYLAFDPGSGAGVVLLRNYNYGATNLGAAAAAWLLAAADAALAGVAPEPPR